MEGEKTPAAWKARRILAVVAQASPAVAEMSPVLLAPEQGPALR
jgi:hypothetical protein